MLWTGDGSEILEYQGSLEAPLEWARYHGSANSIWKKDGPTPGDAEA